jgi:hypothetical protein
MAATQGIAGTAAASETARLAVLTASCCGSLLPAERAALSLRSIALTKNDQDQPSTISTISRAELNVQFT